MRYSRSQRSYAIRPMCHVVAMQLERSGAIIHCDASIVMYATVGL